jgi:protein-S-isoprenylcysteine O-methyltransferase Ste14
MPPADRRPVPATGVGGADGPVDAARGIDLSAVQRRRKLVLAAGIVAAAVLMPFMAPAVPDGTPLHHAIEWAGTALILTCIAGRTWTALYISGIKRVALVASGPYSVVRNPLYLFSASGAAGAGLWTGSLSAGLALAAIAFAVFHVVALSEEAFLRLRFGADFEAYAAEVPRWIPAFGKWRGADWVTIRPSLVTATFLESSIFLVVIPVLEAVEHLRMAGVLPVLFRLV